MARRRYYRRAPRVVVARKKWATCMLARTMTKAVAASVTDHVEDVLVSNSTQSATPTPVVVKTGNFKIQGDCYVNTQQSGTIISVTSQIILYVMYLPEVVVSQANPVTAIQDHPEWVLAWKVVDMNVGSSGNGSSNSNAFSFSSRLKRNLNSGDTIALVAVITNGSTGPVNVTIKYAAQYWTCAN